MGTRLGNRMSHWACVAASLLLISALSGAFLSCQGIRPLAITGHRATRPVEHRQGTNIVAIDNGLTGSDHGAIQVARQHAGWTPDGRLKISVEFENRTSRTLRVQIQTAFKDASDNFLADQTPWKTVPLPRNATYLYEAWAMTKEAQRAHVRVRHAVAQ